jgi:hypothetical protein
LVAMISLAETVTGSAPASSSIYNRFIKIFQGIF